VSNLPTYVLVCDGQGCNERWVTTEAPPRRLTDVRARTRELGWTSEAWPGGVSFARSVDLCPSCSKRAR
jgi:hypothetical protein